MAWILSKTHNYNLVINRNQSDQQFINLMTCQGFY